jgi:hypothetical protein
MNSLIASERIALGAQHIMKLNFRESHWGRVLLHVLPFHSFCFILFGVSAPAGKNLYYVLRRAKLADVNGNAAAARARVKPRTLLLIAAVVWLPVGYFAPNAAPTPRIVYYCIASTHHTLIVSQTQHHCVCVRLFKHRDTP